MKNLVKKLFLLTLAMWYIPCYAESFSGETEGDIVYKIDEKETNEKLKEKVFWTESIEDSLNHDTENSTTEQLYETITSDENHTVITGYGTESSAGK